MSRILLLHNNPVEAGRLAEVLKRAGFEADVHSGGSLPTHELFHQPPALVIVAEGARGCSVETLVRELKADPLLARLPVIVMVRDVRAGDVDWSSLMVDDYITVPYHPEEVIRRVRLCLSRMARSLDANPLTGLPGNTSILHETTRRIESGLPFALAYLDIDNFKSFNDRYGYARGDEVLVVACRLLTTVVQEFEGAAGFVGHVGGDDFVFMSSPAAVDNICQTVIKRFDLVIPDFYDEDDRARGFIDSIDRRGNHEQFPFMTVSIAVVTNEMQAITHPGDVSKLARGSAYLKDRRDASCVMRDA
jgi:GGDEF domain-containing protein